MPLPVASSLGSSAGRFAAAARRHGELRSGHDANCAFKQIIAAYREIRTQADGGLGTFTRLLEDSDPSVAKWAASFLLHDAPAMARKRLEEIAQGDHRLISFSAEITLREWDAGRLKRPEEWKP
ncbi:MAG TPA: hypothetical protein VL017_02045 [Devosia sp.]|nr:hypothetical protein [Sphingomonadaceae bacterium]HTO27351.1 hypothetical protein [Devosia sp.]